MVIVSQFETMQRHCNSFFVYWLFFFAFVGLESSTMGIVISKNSEP